MQYIGPEIRSWERKYTLFAMFADKLTREWVNMSLFSPQDEVMAVLTRYDALLDAKTPFVVKLTRARVNISLFFTQDEVMAFLYIMMHYLTPQTTFVVN